MAARRNQVPTFISPGPQAASQVSPVTRASVYFPQQPLVTGFSPAPTKAEALPGKRGGDRHREAGHPRRGQQRDSLALGSPGSRQKPTNSSE